MFISIPTKNLWFSDVFRGYINKALDKNGLKNDLPPEILKEISVFQEHKTYNLRSGNYLARKSARATQYGIESVSNLEAKLMESVAKRYKK